MYLNTEREGWALYILNCVRKNEIDVMLPSEKILSFTIYIVCPSYTKQSRNNENSEGKDTRFNVKRKLRKSRFQDRAERQNHEQCGMFVRSQARETSPNLTHHIITKEGDSDFTENGTRIR